MPKPENIIGKGFDKHPENINRTGLNRKLISTVNKQLIEEGFTPANKSEIIETQLILLNLPLSKVVEIAKMDNDEYPLLWKLTAKEIIGKRGFDALKEIYDRTMGKPKQESEVKIEGGLTIKWEETKTYVKNDSND